MLEIADHLARNADGHGEGVAGEVARLGINSRVDAHQFAARVDECATAVARVDGRIGLDERLDLVAVRTARHDAAALGADDARRDGRVQVERVADGQHPFAHLELLGVAEGKRLEILGLDLDQGDVRAGIGADDLGGELTIVVERHLQLVGVLNHVVVRYDVPIGGDDHARSRPDARLGCALLKAATVAEEEFEGVEDIAAALHARVHFGGGFDVHHGVHGHVGGIGKVGAFGRCSLVTRQVHRLFEHIVVAHQCTHVGVAVSHISDGTEGRHEADRRYEGDHQSFFPHCIHCFDL